MVGQVIRTIAFDVDGVLRDWHSELIKWYRLDYPFHRILPIKQYPLAPSFPDVGDDIHRYAFEIRAREIYTGAPPIQNAPEVVRSLKADGFRIIIVSNQPNVRTKQFTLDWLEKNGVPYDGIAFIREKQYIDADIFVDDSTANLEAIRAANKIAVAIDQAWNQDWKGRRISFVGNIRMLIEQLEEQEKWQQS